MTCKKAEKKAFVDGAAYQASLTGGSIDSTTIIESIKRYDGTRLRTAIVKNFAVRFNPTTGIFEALSNDVWYYAYVSVDLCAFTAKELHTLADLKAHPTTNLREVESPLNGMTYRVEPILKEIQCRDNDSDVWHRSAHNIDYPDRLPPFLKDLLENPYAD